MNETTLMSAKGEDSLRARFERWLSPGLGTCFRCHRPWRHPAARTRWAWPDKFATHRFRRPGMQRVHVHQKHDRFFGLIGVESHTTYFSDSQGCFPLCEGCWSLLTPEERAPFYDMLIKDWIWQDPERQDEYLTDRFPILEAVLDGR